MRCPWRWCGTSTPAHAHAHAHATLQNGGVEHRRKTCKGANNTVLLVRSAWRAIGRWRGFGLGHPCMGPAKQRQLKILLNTTAAIGIAAYTRLAWPREKMFTRVVRVRPPRSHVRPPHAHAIANPARVCPGGGWGACQGRNARATTIKRTSELLEPSGAGLGRRLARFGGRHGQRCREGRSQRRRWDRHVNGIVQGAIHMLLAQRRRCGGGGR